MARESKWSVVIDGEEKHSGKVKTVQDVFAYVTMIRSMEVMKGKKVRIYSPEGREYQYLNGILVQCHE